jgi:hypothetical protein
MHTCEEWVRLAKKARRIAERTEDGGCDDVAASRWVWRRQSDGAVGGLWVVAANGIMGGLLQVVIGGSIAQTFYLVKSRVQDAGLMQSRSPAPVCVTLSAATLAPRWGRFNAKCRPLGPVVPRQGETGRDGL